MAIMLNEGCRVLEEGITKSWKVIDDAMAAGFALIAAKTKRYYKPQETRKSIESIMPYNKAV